ncbi:hypothetical protein GF322_00740 [Candidatus Dependentiae bacterium]|nr:hypothetical protein [Candidatus Dependentiae bacterium]
MSSRKLNFTCTQVVPDPETMNLDILKEYKQDLKIINKTHLISDLFVLMGYIAAKLFIDLAEKIDGPINKDTIVKQIKQTKNYNFKGLQLNYDTKTNELAQNLWLKKE